MIDPDIAELTGPAKWKRVQQEYLSGVTATTLCQRWGMSMSSFRLHARVGGWRRIDQPGCGVLPEFGEFHPDDRVSFAELADQAFMNIRRAIGTGRARDASSWMRVYDKLADKARAEVIADLPDIEPPEVPEEPEREPLRLSASVMAPDEAPMAPDTATPGPQCPERTDAIVLADQTFPTEPPAEEAPADEAESNSVHVESQPRTQAPTASEPELHALDSVFSESSFEASPNETPEPEPEPEPASDFGAFHPDVPDEDFDVLTTWRARRLEHGLAVHDLDARLARFSPRSRPDPETPAPPPSSPGTAPGSDAENGRTGG